MILSISIPGCLVALGCGQLKEECLVATYWKFHAFVWRFCCCRSHRKSRGERIISLLILPLMSHTIHSHSPLSAVMSISFLCPLYFGIPLPPLPDIPTLSALFSTKIDPPLVGERALAVKFPREGGGTFVSSS